MQNRLLIKFFLLLLSIFSFLLVNPDIYAHQQDHPPSLVSIQKSYVYHKEDSLRQAPHILYSISLQQLSTYFSDVCHIQKKQPHHLNELLNFYRDTFEKPQIISTELSSPRQLFQSLTHGDTYSYVIVDDKLIFTPIQGETCAITNDCRANKHLFLSGLKESVSMAGEFRIYLHPTKEKFVVVFDNNSGSYVPSSQRLPALLALLNNNMYDACVEFVTINRNEKFVLGPLQYKFFYRLENSPINVSPFRPSL